MESGAPLTVIDVRNPVDYGRNLVKIKGAARMTLDEVEAKCSEFDPKIEVVAYCT